MLLWDSDIDIPWLENRIFDDFENGAPIGIGTEPGAYGPFMMTLRYVVLHKPSLLL
jgi:hypothetical protein